MKKFVCLVQTIKIRCHSDHVSTTVYCSRLETRPVGTMKQNKRLVPIQTRSSPPPPLYQRAPFRLPGNRKQKNITTHSFSWWILSISSWNISLHSLSRFDGTSRRLTLNAGNIQINYILCRRSDYSFVHQLFKYICSTQKIFKWPYV